MSTKIAASRKLPQPTLAPDHDPAFATSTKPLPARVLKKREADRRCQRVIRERTKSKIAALEERVRNFENGDASGQVKLLAKQLSDAEKERDSLAKKFKTIENILKESKVDTHDAVEDVGSQSNATPTNVQTSLQTHVRRDSNEADTSGIKHKHSISNSLAGQVETAQGPVLTRQGSHWQQHHQPILAIGSGIDTHAVCETSDTILQRSMQESINKSTSLSGSYTLTATHTDCECLAIQRIPSKQRPFNLWSFANEVLTSHFAWPAQYKSLEDSSRDDTPVRAVVEGWDAVESRGPVHPSWQILRKLDMFVSKLTGPRERLAILYTMHLVLESHLTPDSAQTLPEYYLRRPSEAVSHSYATEFFMWPGVRERFVFAEHTYCTNSFWFLFLRNMRLLWPYELRDCYVYNVETSSYAVSPLFTSHLNDIKVWAMRIEFFERWPELQADIPVFNSIPGSVSTPNERRYHMNMAMRKQALHTPQSPTKRPSAEHARSNFVTSSKIAEERVPHMRYQQPNSTISSSQTPTGTVWMSDPALLPYGSAAPVYPYFYNA